MYRHCPRPSGSKTAKVGTGEAQPALRRGTGLLVAHRRPGVHDNHCTTMRQVSLGPMCSYSLSITARVGIVGNCSLWLATVRQTGKVGSAAEFFHMSSDPDGRVRTVNFSWGTLCRNISSKIDKPDLGRQLSQYDRLFRCP